jgi:AraC-like DNA-binding protein
LPNNHPPTYTFRVVKSSPPSPKTGFATGARIPEECREVFLPISQTYGRVLTGSGVKLAGISNLVSGYRISRTRADFHLLLYTQSGTGRLTAPDSNHALTAGSLLIAPVQSTYSYFTDGESWDIVWFHLADAPRWENLRNSKTHVRPSIDVHRSIPMMAALVEESLGEGLESVRLADLLSEVILLHIERELDLERSTHLRMMRRRLSDLWSSVNADLQRPWSVAELSSIAGMSPVHLNRTCHALGGTSTMRLVGFLRLDRARELLMNTDYPVGLVADMVGYRDAFAFSTAFRKRFGVAPSRYRRAE